PEPLPGAIHWPSSIRPGKQAQLQPPTSGACHPLSDHAEALSGGSCRQVFCWRDSPRGQPNLLLQPFTIHVFDRCILRRAASACSSLSPEPVTGYSLARLLAGWLFVFDPSTAAKIRVAVQQEQRLKNVSVYMDQILRLFGHLQRPPC